MGDRQRVLIIDHSDMVRELVCSRLEELDLELITARDGSGGLAASRHVMPDLILLDVVLPDMSGFEVCDRLRSDPATSEIPVIFLSASEDPDDRVHAFEHGAVDCIRKPFYGDEMRARVSLALRTRSLVHLLERQARSDALTGLPNRSHLTERLAGAIERSRRDEGYGYALLFLDFDRFKIINDSLGHEVGDALLTSIAGRLEASLADCDVAPAEAKHLPARLGGDEFVLLLDAVRSERAVLDLAQRLQQALAAPHRLGEHEVTSTASIGIVIGDGQYARSDDVIRDADTAMYRAKTTGKARHVVFDEAMHAEAMERLHLERDLREAVDAGQFSLAYQPIVDMTTGQLVGFEALLRWAHPRRGSVPPTTFVGLAEEIGLIVPIGAWALREAAAQLRRWHHDYPAFSHLAMNVNLSRAQLAQPDLVESVRRTLEGSGVAPDRIKLEVTESVIMDSPEQSTKVLHDLRALGVGLCMDDFGTGHSSLSCLHRFPIDVLKIDRDFILNTDENREYAAVIHAIVTLAHTLNLTVVGEGVETGGQLAQLQALECDEAQGNFFGVPLSAGAAEAHLRGPRGLAKTA